MKVGFTGTREGMAQIQRNTLRDLLKELNPDEGHHGDCVGADEGFHELCIEQGIHTVGHPPESPMFRAYCSTDETRQERAYIGRNRNIVREVDVLIGCPKELREPSMLRGHGTWSTIRYAIMKRIQVYTILPNGKIEKR